MGGDCPILIVSEYTEAKSLKTVYFSTKKSALLRIDSLQITAHLDKVSNYFSNRLEGR